MSGFSVDAVVMKQKSHELYLFSMNSKLMNKISYVTPRSKNDPEEVQRILNEKRTKELGTYIQQDNSLLPNAIVVSLTSDVDIVKTGDPGKVTIKFPKDNGEYAYLLDGQHRLHGFNHSLGVHFDLPVVALHNVDENLRAKIFADINSKQEKVTDNHVLDIYYHIKQLKHEESQTVDVVYELKNRTGSPLKDKIKATDDEKGTWIKNTMMKQYLEPHTKKGGCLTGKSSGEQATIFVEYLKAVEELWPDAWGNKKYVLVKSLGLRMIFGIFEKVKNRCDLNESRIYTKDTFKNQLSVLKNANLEFAGIKCKLDWASEPFGKFSNATLSEAWRNAMNAVLIEADEKADD